LLRVFGCPAYYHIKEDKLDPRAKKSVFIGFKKGVKGNKIWDPKDKKFVLSRDVTFDKASMLKPTISKQVEIEKIKGISQQVESDATSSSLERSVSLEIILTVIQGSDHVTDQDTMMMQIKDRLWVMSINPLQLEELDKIHVSLVGSLQIRLWFMPSQSLQRQSRLHIGKLKLVQSSRCGRMPWWKR